MEMRPQPFKWPGTSAADGLAVLHWHEHLNAARNAAAGSDEVAPDLRLAIEHLGAACDLAPSHVRPAIQRLRRRLEVDACYAQRQSA
jgi:hypothetical protein